MSGIKHLIALIVGVTLFAIYVLPPALLVIKLIGWSGEKASVKTDERLEMIARSWEQLGMLMPAWALLVLITVFLYKKGRLDKFISLLLGPVDD